MDYVKSIKNKLLNNSPPTEMDINNDNFSKIDSNKYFNLINVSKITFYQQKKTVKIKFYPTNFKMSTTMTIHPMNESTIKKVHFLTFYFFDKSTSQ